MLPEGSCSPLPATGVSGSDRRLPPAVGPVVGAGSSAMEGRPGRGTYGIRHHACGRRRRPPHDLCRAGECHRGISLPSARRLVLRHRWPRQTGNDGVVRVTVPLTAIGRPAKSAEKPAKSAEKGDSRRPVTDPGLVPTTAAGVGATDAVTVAPETDPTTVTLSKAVGTLCEQLAKAGRRIDDLQANLVDAIAAERIAAGAATALRAELDRRRQWRLWRRLRWARRGDRN